MLRGNRSRWASVLLVGLIVSSASVFPASAETMGSESGSISGVVTDQSGNRLAGICVNTVDSTVGGSARTDANGQYTIHLPPGSYELDFIGCAYEYLYRRLGRRVDVSAGATTTGVDVVMKRASSISGRVTDESGAPMTGICLTAHSLSSTGSPGLGTSVPTRTEDDGRYTVRGIPAGSYRIEFHGPCAAESDLLQTSRNVVVGDEEQLAGVDVTMRRGGRVSGAVTSFLGQPMEGVCVGVFGTEGIGRLWGSAMTNAYGQYRTRPIQDGTYVVRFDSCRPPYEPQPFVPQYYREAATAETAERLVIVDGGNLTGINARLVEGADPCIVPDVEGKRLRGARKAIGASNCTVGNVRRIPKRDGAGRIISQRPQPNIVRPQDAKVWLAIRSRP